MKKLFISILILLIMLTSFSSALAVKKKVVKNSKTTKSVSHKTIKPKNAKKVTVAKKTSKPKTLKKTSLSKEKKNLSVTAEAAVLMDMKSGEFLYSKNMHKKLYPASTTKILTAIITLESGSLDRVVTVGHNPTLVEPSKIYLKEGEKIKLRYLLYGLLIESANDAAVAIAEYLGGSQAGFADMMNKKAKLLGCKDSHFANPNGLPNKNHYTSAYDLAIIAKYAMKNPSFRAIVARTSYTIPPTNKYKTRLITGHNKMMLKSTTYYYSGCIGVKTGYTGVARHTLVSAAVRGNKQLMTVVLKDNTTPYIDTINMLNYGFKR